MKTALFVQFPSRSVCPIPRKFTRLSILLSCVGRPVIKADSQAGTDYHGSRLPSTIRPSSSKGGMEREERDARGDFRYPAVRQASEQAGSPDVEDHRALSLWDLFEVASD